MMTIASLLVFAAALSASMMVFAFTLSPELPRIAAVLRGEEDPVVAGRPVLVLRERQAPVPVSVLRPMQAMREAA